MWVVAMICVFPLSALVAAASDGVAERSQEVADILTGVVVVASLALFAGAMLRARHLFRLARTLHADVGEATVEVYQPEEPFASASLPRPLQRMRLPMLKSAEVLPASGVIWRVNGERTAHERWLQPSTVVARTDVADVPAGAMLAADWVQPYEDEALRNVYHNNRFLTNEECAEIQRYRRGLLRFSVPAAALLSLWAGAVAAITGSFPPALKAEDLFRWWLIAGLALYRDLVLLRCLFLSWQLGRDANSGSVAILRTRQSEGSDSLSEPQERLPFSGVLWSLNGIPAEWRLRVR